MRRLAMVNHSKPVKGEAKIRLKKRILGLQFLRFAVFYVL